MFRAFDYSRISKVHRRERRRRLLKKAVQLGLVLGLVLMGASLFLAVQTHLSDPGSRGLLYRLAVGYVGVGMACLVAVLLIRVQLGARRSAARRSAVLVRRRRRRSSVSGAARTRRAAVDLQASRRGVVFLFVLIVLALVSSLALNAQLAARWAHREESVRWDALRLRQAASDGARRAIDRLAADEDLTVDHPDEPWAEPIEHRDPDGIEVRVEVVDENRFFDLNNLVLPERPSVRAPRAVLVDLLTLCGDVRPIGRAQSLLDWLDADDLGLREDAHYAEKEPPYATPDRIALSWWELRWVEGLEPLLSAAEVSAEDQAAPPPRLSDVATVVPVDRETVAPVNVNTAGEATLRGVLGIENPSLFAALLAQRERGPIRGFDAARLPIDPDLIQQLGPYLSVRSEWFRIRAEARRGSHAQRVAALVRRDDRGRVEVRRWAY